MFDALIRKRRSIRKFSNKKVKWDYIVEAIDAANQAPFAGNLNNLKFIILSTQESKNLIADCCQQNWVADASFVVIICSDSEKLERLYDERGKIYSRQQVGAAIENFLLRIVDLKLGACWIGAFSDDMIKRDFKIPEEFNVEAIIPVGHSMEKDRKVRKTGVENNVYWELWGSKKKV
jgi:nitroreductase